MFPIHFRGDVKSTLMHKALPFAVAVATLVGGLWLLGEELLVADTIHFKLAIIGAVLATLGVYLLWADFLAPLLGGNPQPTGRAPPRK
jgi:hypothetical protein